MLTENQQNAYESLLEDYHNDPESGVTLRADHDEITIRHDEVMADIDQDLKEELAELIVSDCVNFDSLFELREKIKTQYNSLLSEKIHLAVIDYIN